MAVQGFSFDASWAGIRIDVTSTSTPDHGRRTIQHEFPKRDGVTLEDQGRKGFAANMEFMFIDRKALPGEDLPIGDYRARFDAFDGIVDEGKIATLIHPYVGAVKCRIDNFSHNADATGQAFIKASATFIEENSLPPVFAADGLGVQTLGGSQDVRTFGTTADDARLAEGLGASPAIASSIAAAEKWELDPLLTTREVLSEMAIEINKLNAELAAIDAATDIDRYPIMRDYTRLQHALRRTAEAFATTTTRIVAITTTEELPLRLIASRFYGADQAERRFDEMRELNPGLRSPVLVARGTVLKALSPNVAPGTFRS